MNNTFLLQITACFFWVMALVLVFVKYTYTNKSKQNYNREIKHKWVGWYNDLKIQGTSSQRFRKFMQTSNMINNGIWLAIFIGIIFLLVDKFGQYLK